MREKKYKALQFNRQDRHVLAVPNMLGDHQLWQILGMNASQLIEHLEENILANPFIELEYPVDQPRGQATIQENGIVLGVDPQLPDSPQTLLTFLFEQIMLYRRTEIRDTMVRLTDYLDERGYLPYTTEQLAEKLKVSEIIVLDAVTLLQQCEPAGVAAYDLAECLMLQTEQDSSAPRSAYYLLEEYFDLLSQEAFEKVAKVSGVALEEVMECVNYYHTLRPHPADMFRHHEVETLFPDVTVDIQDELMTVRYNQRYYPKIQFNENYYQEMMATEDAEVVTYCQPHLLHYQTLSELLDFREQIILHVASAVAYVQWDYLKEEVTHKEPLLVRQIAELTTLPEPIITLALANKYLQSSRALQAMTDYITVSSHSGRDGFNAESVKERIVTLLSELGTQISDREVVERLAEQKIMMSEQMVRNYRESFAETHSH